MQNPGEVQSFLMGGPLVTGGLPPEGTEFPSLSFLSLLFLGVTDLLPGRAASPQLT